MGDVDLLGINAKEERDGGQCSILLKPSPFSNGPS